MNHWDEFPTRRFSQSTPLFRIHKRKRHPAWFNNDGAWRFDPLPGYRDRFGVCYLGTEPLASYVEAFGRFRLVPQVEVDRRALSVLNVNRDIEVADLTDRTILGDFGITAAHSTGAEYGPAQELSSNLFEAGIDGIVYRVRHDPAMTLEGIALFGEPGESPERFLPPKTSEIPTGLLAAGRQFRIGVSRSSPLP